MGKVVFILFTVGICISSCEKNDIQIKNSIPIVIPDKLDVYYDYNPDTVMQRILVCNQEGDYTACHTEEAFYELDIDKDGQNDITIGTDSYIPPNGFGSMGSGAIIELTDNYNICPNPKSVNDTISNKLSWINNPGMKYCLAFQSNDTTYNSWEILQYLAIRKVTPTDTLFGWLKLRIEDYSIITIDSYSMQTKK